MEIENGNQEVALESFSREQVESGEARIPLKNVFPYMINLISQSYGQRTGIDTDIGRNFLLISQFTSRQKIKSIKSYQFIAPIVVDTDPLDEQPPTLLTMTPYKIVTSKESEEKKEKDIILLNLLTPKRPNDAKKRADPTSGALSTFFTFFSEEIRTREFEKKGLEFAHIAASILRCKQKGYLTFDISSDNEPEKSEEIAKKGVRWVFQYYNGELFIYPLTYMPPLVEHEQSFLSPWISADTPCVQRNISPYKYFNFSEEEMVQMGRDEEVEKVLLEGDTKERELFSEEK
jgi:hypothetical protein